jgi:hypothetical protein
MTASSSQDSEVERLNDISKEDIPPKRKWAIKDGRTVSQSDGPTEADSFRTNDVNIPKLKQSKANASDELIDHSVELFSDYYGKSLSY